MRVPELFFVVLKVVLFVVVCLFLRSVVDFERVGLELARDARLLGLHLRLKQLQLLVAPRQIAIYVFLQLCHNT